MSLAITPGNDRGTGATAIRCGAGMRMYRMSFHATPTNSTATAAYSEQVSIRLKFNSEFPLNHISVGLFPLVRQPVVMPSNPAMA